MRNADNKQNLNENKLISKYKKKRNTRNTVYAYKSHASCFCFTRNAFVKFATAFVKHSLAFIHVYRPFVKLLCDDLKTF